MCLNLLSMFLFLLSPSPPPTPFLIISWLTHTHTCTLTHTHIHTHTHTCAQWLVLVTPNSKIWHHVHFVLYFEPHVLDRWWEDWLSRSADSALCVCVCVCVYAWVMISFILMVFSWHPCVDSHKYLKYAFSQSAGLPCAPVDRRWFMCLCVHVC